MTFDRGTIVLVSFTFTDQTEAKRRPAIVLSVSEYPRRRNEVIVAAITGNTTRRLLPGDAELTDWRIAGLAKPSVVTGILRTIKQDRIERILGIVSKMDQDAVDGSLAPSLKFRPA